MSIKSVLLTLLIVGTITFVIVLILMLIRFKVKVADELFRKLMHFTAILMTPLCILFSDNYLVSAAVLLIFMILAEIGLRIIAKIFNTVLPKLNSDGSDSHAGFNDFFVERNDGEIRRSFLIYCFTQACLIVICGLCDDIGLILLEILVWAIGDALAALIGKRWGKRHIKIGDSHKTYLGSSVMFISSLIISFVMLNVLYNFSFIRITVESLVIAVFATLVELLSRKGMDNVTIPVMVTAIGLCFNILM
ncbi:MAG: hypothetical protein K5644_08440 [Lachnospiraceae bacterium]|nr:hypothetical protein [Lachnospiraceae bacterium]